MAQTWHYPREAEDRLRGAHRTTRVPTGRADLPRPLIISSPPLPSSLLMAPDAARAGEPPAPEFVESHAWTFKTTPAVSRGAALPLGAVLVRGNVPSARGSPAVNREVCGFRVSPRAAPGMQGHRPVLPSLWAPGHAAPSGLRPGRSQSQCPSCQDSEDVLIALTVMMEFRSQSLAEGAVGQQQHVIWGDW